jgi:hypothetical protein
MRKLLFIAAAVCGFLCTGCDGGNQASPYSHAGLDSVLQKQVLLVNGATFTKEKLVARGNAFLMRYESQLWAVTAKPWIQADSGSDLPIEIRDLKGMIKSWRLYPRLAVDAPNDTFPAMYDSSQNSVYGEDILFLKAQTDPSQFAVLKPQLELPAVDDTLFLIGCPMSEPGCRQNVYPLTFQKYVPKASVLSFILQREVDLNGFGGAPIVNRRGEVVALLVGGGDFLDLQIVQATHIAAIKYVL